jgi:hypothetical protein
MPKMIIAIAPFPFEAALVALAALAIIAVAYFIVTRWW